MTSMLQALPLISSLLAQSSPETNADTSEADTSVSFIANGIDQGREWLVAHGPELILRAVTFVVILIVFKVLAGIMGRVVSKALSARQVETPALLKTFFVNVVTKVTFFAGLLIALESISVPVAPLLAGAGVLGFVVGFALQDTLGNFAAGIMILLYRPYDIGDVVSAGGVTGKISAMTLVSTTFLTPDNQVMVVPNGQIWGGVITNVTANDTRRVDLVVGVGYDDDLQAVEKVLAEIVTSHKLVLADPAPVIKVHNLGESSVDFVVRPWSKTSDYWDVYWDLTREVKLRLDREGISIPYPQRDIHVIKPDEAVAAG